MFPCKFDGRRHEEELACRIAVQRRLTRFGTRKVPRQDIVTSRYFEAAIFAADTAIRKYMSIKKETPVCATAEIAPPVYPAIVTRPIPADIQVSRARNPLVQQTLAAAARAKKC